MPDDFHPRELAWTPDKARRFWNYFGRRRILEKKYFSRMVGAELISQVRRHGVRFHGTILDWGCGPGFFLEHLLHRHIPCAGADFSQDSLTRAKERVGTHPLCRGLILLNGYPTPLPEAGYDLVFMLEILEHLLPEEQSPLMRDLLRCMKPGGWLVVTTPNDENLESNQVFCPDCGVLFHPMQHVTSWNHESLRKFMESHGLYTTVCTPTFFVHYPLPALARLYWRLARLPWPHLLYVGRKIG